jgi:hypothetical protein
MGVGFCKPIFFKASKRGLFKFKSSKVIVKILLSNKNMDANRHPYYKEKVA